jgi:hypothetical protein
LAPNSHHIAPPPLTTSFVFFFVYFQMGNVVAPCKRLVIANEQAPLLALHLTRDLEFLVLDYAVDDVINEFRRACIRGDRTTMALAFELVCRKIPETASAFVNWARRHAVDIGDVSLARWITETLVVSHKILSRTNVERESCAPPRLPSPLPSPLVVSGRLRVEDLACAIAQNARYVGDSGTDNAMHWYHRSVSDTDWDCEEFQRVSRSRDPRNHDVLLLCDWETPTFFGMLQPHQLRVTPTHLLWKTYALALHDITHVKTLDVDLVRILTSHHEAHDVEVPERIRLLLTQLLSQLAAN